MFSNYEFPKFDKEVFLSKEVPEPLFSYNEEIRQKPDLHSSMARITLIAVQRYKDNEKVFRKDFAKRVKELDKQGYKTIRASVEVNGKKIDMIFFGKKENLDNRKWILFTLHNKGCFEEELTFGATKRKIDALGYNALFFNYPGVGCSKGEPHQSEMIAAYHAMLRILEDQIRADTVIMDGTSIGGGLEGSSLNNYQFKEGLTYLSLIEQSFDELPNVPNDLSNEALPPVVNFFIPKAVNRLASTSLRKLGWSLESVTSATQLEEKDIRQVIVQNTKELNNRVTKPEEIVGDGIISADVSLAKAILSQKREWTTKRVVGIRAGHAGRYTRKEEKMIIAAIKEELELSKPYHSAKDAADTSASVGMDDTGSILSSSDPSPSHIKNSVGDELEVWEPLDDEETF